jgi:hypothetical protein
LPIHRAVTVYAVHLQALVIEPEVVFPMPAHKLLLFAALLRVPPFPLDPVYAPVLSDLEKHPQQKGEWEKEYPHPPQLGFQYRIVLPADPCHGLIYLSILTMCPFPP